MKIYKSSYDYILYLMMASISATQ